MGLHLNNMMGEEDLAAGRHRGPGGRLTSMQAPSILTRDGQVRLVVGSSGSNRLRSAITQVIANVVDHGMPVTEAVSSPRVHVEGDRLTTRGGRSPPSWAAGRWGEQLVRFDGRTSTRRRQRGAAGRRGELSAVGVPAAHASGSSQ